MLMLAKFAALAVCAAAGIASERPSSIAAAEVRRVRAGTGHLSRNRIDVVWMCGSRREAAMALVQLRCHGKGLYLLGKQRLGCSIAVSLTSGLTRSGTAAPFRRY